MLLHPSLIGDGAAIALSANENLSCKVTSTFLLVIPAYREVYRLPHFLRVLQPIMAEAPYLTDILIVDDGSPAREQHRLQSLIREGKVGNCRIVAPIFLNKNQGKGGAILNGWRRCKSEEWLAFVDADGAIPAYEVRRLCDYVWDCRNKKIAYFASRQNTLNRRVKRFPLRAFASLIFRFFVRFLIDKDIIDSQCGFKIVSRELFNKVEGRVQSKGFCFDMELLLAVKSLGAVVHEIPIDWQDKRNGSVNLLWDSPSMVYDMIQIRWRAWRQKYEWFS